MPNILTKEFLNIFENLKKNDSAKLTNNIITENSELKNHAWVIKLALHSYCK